MVSVHDKNFKLVRVNKAFADAFKLEPRDIIGKHCYEMAHGTAQPVSSCPYTKTLDSQKPETTEFFEPHLGIHLEVSASPIKNENGVVTGVVHVAHDITERKKMQEQLMITDRLASIGEMASGIAHELNNPLTSVIGFSQLIMEGRHPSNIREDIELINQEAQRTAQIVKNLLTFACKHTPVKQLVNVNSIIEKVLSRYFWLTDGQFPTRKEHPFP